MTKATFLETARIISWYQDKMTGDSHDALIRDFAQMFAKNNPRFDESKFKEACKA